MQAITVIRSDDGTLWDQKVYEAAPTHLRMKLKASAKPTILVGCKAPFPILAANQEWQDKCGYGKDAIGRSPNLLQGELTNRDKARAFCDQIVHTGKAATTLVNYDSNHSPFVHKLHATAVDGFFLTESQVLPPDSPIRRAMCKVDGHSVDKELLAISLALLLTSAVVVLEPSALLPASSASTFATVTTPVLDAHTEAFVVATMTLLSFFVVAINHATTDAAPHDRQTKLVSKDDKADMTVAFSLVLGVACLIVDLAPHVPNGAAVVILALVALAHSVEVSCKTASTCASTARDKESDARPTDPARGLAEVIFTTVVCLTLIFPPLGYQYLGK